MALGRAIRKPLIPWSHLSHLFKIYFALLFAILQAALNPFVTRLGINK